MPTRPNDEDEPITLDIHDAYLGVTIEPVLEEPEAEEEK